MSEAARPANFLQDNGGGSVFIVSNESSVSRPVELESPTSRAVGICEIDDRSFSNVLHFFSSGAKVGFHSAHMKGGKSRRYRLEGQREVEDEFW